MGADDGGSLARTVRVDTQLSAEHLGVADELTVTRNRTRPAGPGWPASDEPRVGGHDERGGILTGHGEKSGPSLPLGVRRLRAGERRAERHRQQSHAEGP